MKLLKTNSKQYKNNFENYFNTLFPEHTDNYIKNIDDFVDHFNNEANFENNKKRIPNLQLRFADYLQGMPYGFNFCYNDDFLELAAELHELKEIPKDKEKIIVKNFYIHCAGMFLKLCKKETLEKLY